MTQGEPLGREPAEGQGEPRLHDSVSLLPKRRPCLTNLHSSCGHPPLGLCLGPLSRSSGAQAPLRNTAFALHSLEQGQESAGRLEEASRLGRAPPTVPTVAAGSHIPAQRLGLFCALSGSENNLRTRRAWTRGPGSRSGNQESSAFSWVLNSHTR